MKKIVLALALVATGFANAQSSSSTVPAAESTATSTTQAPAAPKAYSLSFDLETRSFLPQTNAEQVEPNTEIDLYPQIKWNKRHALAAYAMVVAKYDDRDQEGGNQEEAEIPADPYLQYKYRLTSPDIKSHNSAIAFRTYVPTSAGSVANKNDGSLRIRYDYTSVQNIGPVGLTVIFSPFAQKYFNQDVAFTATRPEFAFGQQFVLAWEYKKLWVENNLDFRVFLPMRDGTQPEGSTPATTMAYLDSYIGLYLNQANTLSVFAMYLNDADMIDGRGYEFQAFNGDVAVYALGIRGSF